MNNPLDSRNFEAGGYEALPPVEEYIPGPEFYVPARDDEPTLLMSLGLSETLKTVQSEVDLIVEQGCGVAVAHHPRWGERPQLPVGIEDYLANIDVNLGGAAAQRPLNILMNLMAIDRHNQESSGIAYTDPADRITVSGVGHSLGCMDLVVAALLDPARFQSLTLENPGIIGQDSEVALYARFLSQLHKNSPSQNMWGSLDIMKNLPKSVDETFSVANSDLLGLIYKVREAGVPISIIMGQNDPLFPADRMWQRIADQHYWMNVLAYDQERKSVELPIDRVSVYRGAHHNTGHQRPEEAVELRLDHVKSLAGIQGQREPGTFLPQRTYVKS